MKSNIQIRAVTSLHQIRGLEPEWDELWARCPGLTVFQHPDWLVPWIEVFSPSRLWVLEGRQGTALVALAPLFIYGTGGDRIVAPLGAGISDYLDVLIDPEVPEALNALVEFLRAHSSAWTELQLPDLRDSSPLLGHEFLVGFNPEEFDFAQPQACEFCPRLNLPASIEELHTVVPAKQLRNLRAARRQLDGAHAELATSATLEEFLGSLFRLHEKRWRLSGEAGVLADPRVRQLHTRVAPRLLERGVLRLFGLRHREELIACLMAFSYDDAIQLYLQGYDPDWARCSPGAQLVGTALEQAVRERKCVADFMRGRETYKYYWGCRDVPTFRLQIASRPRAEASIPEKSAA